MYVTHVPLLTQVLLTHETVSQSSCNIDLIDFSTHGQIYCLLIECWTKKYSTQEHVEPITIMAQLQDYEKIIDRPVGYYMQ